jgi:hypothetical protein
MDFSEPTSTFKVSALRFKDGDKALLKRDKSELKSGDVITIDKVYEHDYYVINWLGVTGYVTDNDLELIEDTIVDYSDINYYSTYTPTQTDKEKIRKFETGAVRDTNVGKSRPDLISPYMLEALGKVLAEGAAHYGDRNWEKGMPQEVFKESAARHYVAWMMNKTDEDHAAKLIFNVMAWIHFREIGNDIP